MIAPASAVTAASPAQCRFPTDGLQQPYLIHVPSRPWAGPVGRSDKSYVGHDARVRAPVPHERQRLRQTTASLRAAPCEGAGATTATTDGVSPARCRFAKSRCRLPSERSAPVTTCAVVVPVRRLALRLAVCAGGAGWNLPLRGTGASRQRPLRTATAASLRAAPCEGAGATTATATSSARAFNPGVQAPSPGHVPPTSLPPSAHHTNRSRSPSSVRRSLSSVLRRMASELICGRCCAMIRSPSTRVSGLA